MRVISGVVLAIVLTCPRVSAAQTGREPSVPPRAFLDVNLIGASKSASGERVFTSRFLTFGEAGSERATYPKPSNVTLLPSFDVGGGYITGTSLGLGFNINRTSFEDAASLGATIPHPLVLNSSRSAQSVTDRGLTRKETAISAFVTAVPVRTSRAELRFFGGPTYFRVNAEMVQSVLYSQASSVTPLTNVITINGFTTVDAKGGGFGFHLGTDFTYFFTKRVGARGGFRYSRARVTVKNEPLSKLEQDLIVGGPVFFLGARFRFGK